MDIGFVWDENKYNLVVKEHKLKFYEVVSAFDDPNGYEISDPSNDEDRWLWVGKAFNNRILAVVYSEEDLPLYRLITAFDAKGILLNEYQKRQEI